MAPDVLTVSMIVTHQAATVEVRVLPGGRWSDRRVLAYVTLPPAPPRASYARVAEVLLEEALDALSGQLASGELL